MFFKKKKNHTPVERVEKAKRLLNDYLHFSTDKKLECFDSYLANALEKLCLALSQAQSIDYSEYDALKYDSMLIGVQLIPYKDKNGNNTFVKYPSVLQMSIPNGKYEVLDIETGKYSINGKENYSIRLAVDYSLKAICTRWVKEIPNIEKLLGE